MDNPTQKINDNQIEKEVLRKVGKRLREYRKEAGYTNYEYFAYENNISRPQYGKYEAGANIQLNTLIRILKALDVSLEEFFEGFDEPKQVS
jgi:transcriptional regulator with XRE-family HTH domain